MKRNKLFLLPLFMLLLAGCRDTSQSSEPPAGSSAPTTSVVASSEEDLPSEHTSIEDLIPVRTIAEIRGMTTGNDSATTAQKELKYQVSGTVTHKFRGAVYGGAPAWNIAIQDDNHNALLLYALTDDNYQENFKEVPLGAYLTVTGNLATYNGLRELDTIQYVSHTEGTPLAPLSIASVKKADLVGKDSVLVEIDGLKLVAKPTLEASVSGEGRTNITVTMPLKKGDDSIGTYMHYNIPIEDAQATVALLETVKSSDSIKWTGILGMNSGDYQLTNAKADEWDITDGGPVVATAMEFASPAYSVDEGETVEPSLKLTPFDAALTGVTYSSSDPLIASVDATGVVTGVAAGEITLTATLGSLNAETTVTVRGPDIEYVEHTVKVKDSITSGRTLAAGTFLEDVEGFPAGSSVTTIDKVYSVWKGDTNVNNTNDLTAVNSIKFSTGKANAELKIELPEDFKVDQVTITGRAWLNDDATVAINSAEPQSFMKRNPDNFNEVATYVYDLGTPASELEFKFVKRVFFTEVILRQVIVGDLPGEPEVVENFASLPAGHTSIADIMANGVLDESYTTRGVVLGTNGGAFYLQDPLSGASIGGFGLNNEQKLLLHPGTVIDVAGKLAVNNNGKQLASLTLVEVVAEENLSKVAPFVVDKGADLTALVEATDYVKHARFVKLVGVKVVSVEEGGTNRFKVDLGGVVVEVSVNFMDSADALGKNRPAIKALVTQLMDAEVVFNLYVVQLAKGTGGFSLALGTTDYFEAPREHFAALPDGHTSIADIMADGVLDETYTTRGVVLGTNGGAFYLQDPISGASIGGFGLTNEQKLLLHPGTVIDVAGKLAVNNNGKQLASLTLVEVVAEENLSKVAPFVVDKGADLAALVDATDYANHARFVKLVGVKVVSVEEGGTNRFKVDLGGVVVEVSVNFMDSADALGKNRPAIKALVTQLLADETVFDLYVVQLAKGAGGFSLALGTTDYFVLPVA